MKANEAPEKIILSADRETGKLYDEWVIKDLTDNIKIEYTRTDVFIEEVEEYIYKQLNEGRIECGDIEKFIDGFKKYMGGE